MPTNNQDNTNYIIGGVAIIIVILIGWFLITRHAAPSMTVGENTSTSTDNGSQSQGGSTTSSDSVSVSDQAAGLSVAVTSMSLSDNSWVAVRELSTGNILGAGWFPAGTTSGSVPLLRGTIAGGKYEAVVYTDNGDKAFDMHTDKIVDGVSSAFNAQ